MKDKFITSLFPSLAESRPVQVNLDSTAREFCRQKGLSLDTTSSHFNDPVLCQEMVQDTHRQLEAGWSYGGYLEDRSFLWKGSYLEKTGNFIHLGVDWNVPAGTEVMLTYPAEVVYSAFDPSVGGWGSMVIMEPELPGSPDCLFIYAHLVDLTLTPGIRLEPGSTIARVGTAPNNGNWYPHMHLQALSRGTFEHYLNVGFQLMDGYGHASELERLRLDYPDPIQLLSQLSSR